MQKKKDVFVEREEANREEEIKAITESRAVDDRRFDEGNSFAWERRKSPKYKKWGCVAASK